MVVTKKICRVLNASGKKPADDLRSKFCLRLKMQSINWREELFEM